MTDTVVSVRMPSSLVRELKELAERNHFKDLSEEIRSIVRSKCLNYAKPYQGEIRKLREDISDKFSRKKELQQKQTLVKELSKILEELKDEV